MSIVREMIKESVTDAFAAVTTGKQEIAELVESISFWQREYLEMEALLETESGDISDLSEATVKGMAKAGGAVGAIAGGLIGGAIAGPGGAIAGAALGAADGALKGTVTGALFSRGAQRDIQAKIDRAEKKLRSWGGDPKNKEKSAKLQAKLVSWKNELAALKKRGSGGSGVFRSSHEKVMSKRK